MSRDPEAMPDLTGVRTTVLGASGFVGGWVARAARDAGADVTAVARTTAGVARIERFVGEGVHTRLQALDPEGLASVLSEARPQLVLNLAGYGVDPSERDEETARWVNEELVRAVCQALDTDPADGYDGLRLVHVGSALEYGEARGDLNESTPEVPTTLYGQTKLGGTQAVRAAHADGLRATTARLFTVYGPGEHRTRLLPTLRAAAREEGPIELTAGKQLRDFTFVGDVAESLLRLAALRTLPPDVVNVATGQLTSVRTVVEVYAEILGIASERLHFGALPTRVEEMAHEPVNVERLRSLVGWVPPTSIEAGLQRTAASTASASGE